MKAKSPSSYFPKNYLTALCHALKIKEDELYQDQFLEALFKMNHNWIDDQTKMDYQLDIVRAYTSYYMTINIPKLWYILNRSNLIPKIFSEDKIKIAEYGCGPGTFIWSLLFYLQNQNPDYLTKIDSINAVDLESDFLNMAERLQKTFAFSKIPMNFTQANWSELSKHDYNLLMITNSINENETIPLEFWDSIDAKCLILIEPGTSKRFHHLLSIRDHLMASEKWSLAFPCPQYDKCPMQNTDNWCHFHINRFSLPFIQKMSNKAKRLNHRHNFSAFVFIKEEIKDKGDWRILSKVRRVKRSAVRWVCDGKNLNEVVLNRREKSESNVAFSELETGKLIKVQPDPEKTIKSGRLKKYHKISD